MPLYTYRCNNCNYTFDANQRMSDAPLRECPSCGLAELRRVISNVGVVFKGPGFYVTDSRKGSSSNGSSATSPKKSQESKTEKKADTSTPAAE